jgi:hypothetical protein
MKRWLLIAVLLGSSALPAVADPILRWDPADRVIGTGQEVTLSIMLDDALPVRTIELFVGYDSDIISTVDGGPGLLFDPFQGSLFSGFVEVDPGNPGQWHGYCVILGAGDWTVGPGELFNWTIQGSSVGISGLVSVSVVLLPPGGGEYADVELPMTEVIVLDPAGVPTLMAGDPALHLSPNPFNPRVQVDFNLGDQMRGLLEVYDMRGRRVTTLWQGIARQAEQIDWDGRDAQGRSMPSGVYTFALQGIDGSRVTARGTLIR